MALCPFDFDFFSVKMTQMPEEPAHVLGQLARPVWPPCDPLAVREHRWNPTHMRMK